MNVTHNVWKSTKMSQKIDSFKLPSFSLWSFLVSLNNFSLYFRLSRVQKDVISGLFVLSQIFGHFCPFIKSCSLLLYRGSSQVINHRMHLEFFSFFLLGFFMLLTCCRRFRGCLWLEASLCLEESCCRAKKNTLRKRVAPSAAINSTLMPLDTKERRVQK